MKLSVVIICWNDLQHIGPCLRSVDAGTEALGFEVIVTDNGSIDSSPSYVREHFPGVHILANGANLGFGPGSNAGIRVAEGEYVLILNPDRSCRRVWVPHVNSDGSLQGTAHPRPTLSRYLIKALYPRWLGTLSDSFPCDEYVDSNGLAVREIGFHAGCCLLVRSKLLKALGGFDEKVFPSI